MEAPWQDPQQVGLRFEAALQNAEDFFMDRAKVQQAMRALCEALDQAGIPYAIAGALALNAHGYQRMTTDVDLLLTREGLERAKALLIGRGYTEKFPGSKGFRDTVNQVPIDVLIAGDYPGDGKPKPVAFPHPDDAIVSATVRVLKLPVLVELKLASGMTAPHRLKDLADVVELIRAIGLPESFGEGLDPYVRERYRELWRAAQSGDDE